MLPESGKDKGLDFPLESPQGASSPNILTFNWGNRVWASGHLGGKKADLSRLKLVVLCHSGKLTQMIIRTQHTETREMELKW